MARILTLGAASVAFLLALGGSQAAGGGTPALVANPDPQAVLTQLAHTVGGGGANPQASRYRYLQKLDGHLQDVAVSRLDGGSAPSAARREGVLTSAQGDVLVDVYVTGDVAQAADSLRALGMRVTAVSDAAPQRMVEGTLPASALTQAAALASTRAILPTIPPVASTGSVTSQGDAAIDGPQARATGATGAGVRVGIISDSINEVGGGIVTSQGTGDLPTDTQDLLDDPTGEDEGRAMAEIVHDEAPDASIAFSSGTLGVASKASSIDNLVSDGAKVIADDISYPSEPFFQDDVIAQAVDRAKAAGVAYFASAGNFNGDTWQADYAPVADPTGTSPSTENFDAGGGVDTVQSIGTLQAGDAENVDVQWAEPWGHATSDFAVDVYSISGGVPTFAFTVDTNNIETGIPEEQVSVHALATTQLGIAIRRVSGTGTPLLKFIVWGASGIAIEHATGGGSIAPDAPSAAGAMTVAAADYATPTTPEFFSSRGPVTRLFDANGTPFDSPEVLQKPDITGPDGVSTSVQVTGLTTFFGTSAAAPAVAGIAALMFSAKPSLPVDELEAILENPANALPCTSSSPALDCGVGFELADRALAQEELDLTPPTVTATTNPATPNGANGWYQTPVNVSFTVSDPDSPIVDVSGCGSTNVVDASVTLTCKASSAGGATSLPISIKSDTTPPTEPAISGVVATTYYPGTLPAASAVGCSASDPTSGVDSCTVTGFGATLGQHTLTAVATNDAGLTSMSTLVYTVAPTPMAVPTTPTTPTPTSPAPAAISGLTVAKSVSLGTLVRSGAKLTVHVATSSTRLVVTIVARIPRSPGHAARLVTLSSHTITLEKGTRHISIGLTAAAKRRLRGVASATLRLTVRASSSGSKTVTLEASSVVHAK